MFRTGLLVTTMGYLITQQKTVGRTSVKFVGTVTIHLMSAKDVCCGILA
jgi:hypothetical protein